jgi:hypothetical protein
MRVNVRIDELVVDGLELSRRERDALAPAVQRELRRLVAATPAGRPGRHPRVDRIARDVALAVHRSMPPVARSGGSRR